MIPFSIYFFLLIQLAAVSYLDILYKKISNVWFILNLILFVILTLFYSEFYKLNFNTLYFSLVFLLVGIFLFAVKIMGAGDSKYLVSFYLLVPVSLQEEAMIYLLYSTCLIGGGVFLYNLKKNWSKIKEAAIKRDIKTFKEQFGKKFAFAPVILLSWILLGWKIKEKIF